MICYLFPEPIYLLFSPDAPSLLYYAYIPTAAIALLVGFYTFWNNRKLLLNQLLLLISVIFTFWAFSILIEWTNIHSDFILFVWNFQGIIFSILAILSIYFIYVFLDKKDVSVRMKVIFLTLFAPIFLATPTLYLKGFNITNCDAFNFEWGPFKFYYTFLGILAIIWILVLLVRGYRKTSSNFRKQIVLMGTGIELFLFLFFIWTFLIYYLTEKGILLDSRIEMYGMLGMVIFMIYINILIVRFKTFNVKLLATQALVWGLVIIIGSEFFFIQTNINRILTAITLVISAWLGLTIIRSVKKEIEQKEELEKLTAYLETANEKLKSLDNLKTEFLSLATHQLRSPIAAIKGYSSMLLDGSYGPVTEKLKDPADKIFKSSERMNHMIVRFLDVAKIEKGGMQYTMQIFELGKMAEEIVNELSVTAKERGLTIAFETDNKSPYMINADREQMWQVVQNLIDNSIKYTKTGWIKVKLSKDEKENKITLSVSDSGMGIKPEILPLLFQKFSRGEGSKMNADGSGIGLFVAKNIIENGHHGKIWAESEGAGKGSMFTFELPLSLENKPSSI